MQYRTVAAPEIPSPGPNFPSANAEVAAAGQGNPISEGDVGELRQHLHERHEQWLREQYLRDEATIARIEQQLEERCA